MPERVRLPEDLRIQEPFLAGSVFRIEGEGHPAVARARYAGDSDFVRPEHERACKAAFAERTRRLGREKRRPVGIETRMARAIVATRGTERQKLAPAMAERIRKERSAVLAKLQRDAPEEEHPVEESGRKEDLLQSGCASFPGAEVREMCAGKGSGHGAAARRRGADAGSGDNAGAAPRHAILGSVALARATGGARAELWPGL
ncbi:MAG: hypothetical protein F4X97_00950 [Boseongicola sp. SB0662_bin_57]|nr:hypothetical protein [Boseongicola sp. SB0662_bin_57]